MSTIKSSDEHLTLNADGSSKDIKFQANGVEKASISSSGAFTSTTIDATALTGNLPAISAASLTNIPAANITGALPAISGANLTGLKAGSGAFAARSHSSWVAINNSAIVQFNTDSGGDNFDTDGVYNTSSYKYVAPAAGVYMFWYAVYTAQSDTDNAFGFLKNSAKLNFQNDVDNMFTRWNGSVDDHIQTATIIVPLASGDTMAVCAAKEGDYYGGHSQWGGCRLA